VTDFPGKGDQVIQKFGTNHPFRNDQWTTNYPMFTSKRTIKLVWITVCVCVCDMWVGGKMCRKQY